MKTLILYFKLNSITLLGLTAVTALPLAFILSNFPNQFPDIQYLFFAILFIIKIILFREKETKKALQSKVPQDLRKELKRVPSHKEIHQRIMTTINGKDLTFILVAITILITTLIFKAF
ncbi:MAG: hypothetical protein VYD54_09780 [Bdellovibrionota bacterium]|nr:hypothetical protein [Bdellovibrionota bacterium]